MAEQTGAALDFGAIFDAIPTPYLVLSPDLVIVEMNRAREQATGRSRDEVVGRHLFEAFPDNPDDPGASGVANLGASLRRVLATRRPDVMPVQKYDVRAGDAGFTDRWWSPVNAPVFDDAGRVVLLLHRVEDVTELMRAQKVPEPSGARVNGGSADRAPAERAKEEVGELEADLWVRGHQLRAALTAEAATSARLASLVEVAIQLARADSVAELTALVFERGLGVLDADGAVIATMRPDGELDVTVTSSLILPALGSLSHGAVTDLPVWAVATTGREVLLGDPVAARGWSPGMAEVVETAGVQAWASLPLASGGVVLGSLSVAWRSSHTFTDRDVELLRAFAGLCAQTLTRLAAQERERELAAAERDLAAALQRTLLTAPLEPDHLAVAVRYVPAAHGVQVGGDWYDCFLTPDGTATLVIGDVTGHDRDAAAAMAQLRNLLRGICVTQDIGPAAALSALERAAHLLAVGSLATAVLARVEQPAELAQRGLRSLRWSNAGHPPPVLIPPNGPVRLLTAKPQRLLGVTPWTQRQDYRVDLEPGSKVVLYTDGLVERRDTPLESRLTWLVDTLTTLRDLTAEQLCDALLHEVRDHHDDDIALLVMHAYPEDRPRPAEAGPSVLPADLRAQHER